MKHYKEFSEWLDIHLSDKSLEKIKAFCFNCYEGAGEPSTWDMELIGSKEFNEEDEDWPCPFNEVFNTRDDLLYIPRTEEIFDWEEGLALMKSLVTKYIQRGKFANKLKGVQAVAIGHVNGDLHILYRS